MSALALLLVRGQRWPRLVLVIGCAGLVAVLLLLAVTVVELPYEVDEVLFPLLAEPGLRPGFVLALVLLALPVLLLLYQLLRLGTGQRQRRLAVLRTVGATPTQARLLSAAELIVPAAVGAAVLGPLGLALLRTLFGGRTTAGSDENPGGLRLAGGFVPTTVEPATWQVLLVVVVVTALCGLIGWRVSREVVRTPWALARRAVSRRPRPWALVVVVGGIVVAVPFLASTIVVVCAVGVVALGLVLCGPWLASAVGTRAAGRTSSPARLLAGSRMAADPWAAGRAAAPLSVVGLVSAGVIYLVLDLVSNQILESFYVISTGLVVVALLGTLAFVVLTLAVHGVETLGENGRSTASLAAAGASTSELSQSLVEEARLLAGPAAVLGVVVGSVAITLVGVTSEVSTLFPLTAVATVVVLVAVVEVAARLSAQIVSPWLVAATRPDALRTA